MTRDELRLFQRRLHSLEALIESEFTAWVDAARARLTPAEIENAVAQGLSIPLEAALMEATLPDLNLAERVWREGERALREVGGAIASALHFDRTDPRFLIDIQEAASRAMQQVLRESISAVRESIARASRAETPRIVAPVVSDAIGLTRRQTHAVLSFHQGALEAGDENHASEVTQQYAELSTQRRGKTISRHQAVEQANLARLAAFQQAARAGAFDPSRAELEWIALLDEKTCPTCVAHDGDTTPLGETFDGDFPPQHPSCRCSVFLVLR